MIQEKLSAVSRRLRLASLVRAAVSGLAIGSACALLFAVVKIAAFPSVTWLWAPGLMAAGLCCGAASVLFGNFRPEVAARVVDERCDLKDGGVSALQFLAEQSDDAARKLQVEQTEQQFATVDPVACVPVEVPGRSAGWAGGMIAAVAVAFLVSTLSAPDVDADVRPLSLAIEQSTELREEMLKDIEELAEETEDPAIEELLKELEEKVDALESESIDEADLLATLSEMEQAIAEAQEALNPEMTDATLKALAEAIKPSEALQSAAKALENEDYDKAAEDLKNADLKNMSDKQRRAVSDNLKKMLSKLTPGQKGELSDSIGELVEGLEKKNDSQCKKCMSKICKACKKAGQCKKCSNCMACQLNRLSQCKGQCRGQCNGNKVAKSNSPSLKAGKGASGEPLGDKATSLDGSRKEEQISGAHSDGPTETEITQAPEGEQVAARAYAQKFSKFKREAEAVLDSEPLPLGHRETVQKYFESIRPSNDEASAAAEAN